VEVAVKYSATVCPTTDSFAYGLVVPMPTLPPFWTRITFPYAPPAEPPAPVIKLMFPPLVAPTGEPPAPEVSVIAPPACALPADDALPAVSEMYPGVAFDEPLKVPTARVMLPVSLRVLSPDLMATPPEGLPPD